MEAFDILLRLVGGFYVFAGFVAMRAAAMDRMMDQMLSAISLEPQPLKESLRRWLWSVTALAVGMGGAALVVLNLWAAPLFVVGTLAQAVYLVWAKTAFVPDGEIEEKGRGQTINAAVLHAVCTVLALLAAFGGRLSSWLDPWALLAPATGVFILATVGRNLMWRPGRRRSGSGGDDDFEEFSQPADTPDVRGVRLQPTWLGLNLVDLDTGEGVDPWNRVDDALATRIYQWALAFRATEDENDQRLWAEFTGDAEEAAHRAEGAAIVGELRRIFGDSNAEGPVYPADIRHTG